LFFALYFLLFLSSLLSVLSSPGMVFIRGERGIESYSTPVQL
jgi:hypothetical protein